MARKTKKYRKGQTSEKYSQGVGGTETEIIMNVLVKGSQMIGSGHPGRFPKSGQRTAYCSVCKL